MIQADRVDDFDDRMHGLYESAFSEIEKVPLDNITRTFGHGGELLSLRDGTPTIGMMYSFTKDDITFLVYFAIDDGIRSKGYGSQALKIFSEMHDRIFLVMEPVVDSPDIDIRRRRRDFYIRNGCREMDFTVISDDAPFSVMVLKGELSEREIVDTVSYYEDVHNGRV